MRTKGVRIVFIFMLANLILYGGCYLVNGPDRDKLEHLERQIVDSSATLKELFSTYQTQSQTLIERGLYLDQSFFVAGQQGQALPVLAQIHCLPTHEQVQQNPLAPRDQWPEMRANLSEQAREFVDMVRARQELEKSIQSQASQLEEQVAEMNKLREHLAFHPLLPPKVSDAVELISTIKNGISDEDATPSGFADKTLEGLLEELLAHASE